MDSIVNFSRSVVGKKCSSYHGLDNAVLRIVTSANRTSGSVARSGETNHARSRVNRNIIYVRAQSRRGAGLGHGVSFLLVTRTGTLVVGLGMRVRTHGPVGLPPSGPPPNPSGWRT